VAPFIKNNRRLIFSLIVLILLGTYVIFSVFIGPDRNVFALQLSYPETLSLRLSPVDLKTLNDSRNAQWVSADLAERFEVPVPVKIRWRDWKYGLDFEVEHNGFVYHLFQLNERRRKVYDNYRKLEDPGFMVLSNRTIRLKLNEVLIGIYVVENKVYDQVRDAEGNYDLRQGSDTHFLRMLRYEVESGRVGKLERNFDIESLLNFMLFLHRAGFGPENDFSRMIMHYDARRKLFVPRLTMESLLSITDAAESSDLFADPFVWHPISGPYDEELDTLHSAFRDTDHFPMIDMLIELWRKKAGGG
jgi:hypothetical protein